MVKKSFVIFLMLLLVPITDVVDAQRRSGGSVRVRGHFRKDGTYVPPHYRSAPDGNFYNNWSTKGNVNPYTGKEGTRESPPTNYGGTSTKTPNWNSPTIQPRESTNREPANTVLPPTASKPPLVNLPTPILPPLSPPPPRTAEAWYDLGLTNYKARDYKNAIAAFKNAIKQKADYTIAYYFLGISFYQLDQYSNALAVLQEAARQNPSSAGVQFYLGAVYSSLNRSSEALESFKAVVRLAPDRAFGHFGLGLEYYSRGKYGRAVRPLREAIRLNPNDIDAHLILGFVYAAVGNKEAALKEYRTLLSLDPDQALELLKAINK